jgi:hypothetical protein
MPQRHQAAKLWIEMRLFIFTENPSPDRADILGIVRLPRKLAMTR